MFDEQAGAEMGQTQLKAKVGRQRVGGWLYSDHRTNLSSTGTEVANWN